ncbi:MAG: phenylphosphate synthase subunit beta [Deltaproteobacteria bacterium]|jgi:pyruvate,water dikinase|nr:phenylphosphate synthase subunit beta [Deltaproteobacteria bacterium]
MEYVLNFREVDKNSLSQVGGKNASLGELIKADIRVPPGFAVTTDSYQQFITETGIKDTIFQVLSEIKPGDIAALNAASENIQGLIQGSTLSESIRRAIDKAYAQLCNDCQVRAMPVAVRSSATAEDLPTASFAGQQDTYLWIQGVEAVVEKVQYCWASLFTPRAIDYRVKNNFPHEKVLISVGIQKMVNSRAAGVMFTLNPTDGDLSKVVIECSWGLGETVVSGSVNPDKFVVDKVVMETSDKTISTKHIACVYDPEAGKVVDADVDDEMQCKCCLEDREVKALVVMGKLIEQHYKRPMDIEWAIDRDYDFPENIFIVQARPETVWSQRKTRSVIGGKSGYQLLMEQAMKRIKIPS